MSFNSDKRLGFSVMMKISSKQKIGVILLSLKTVLADLKSRVEIDESLKIAQLRKLIHG